MLSTVLLFIVTYVHGTSYSSAYQIGQCTTEIQLHGLRKLASQIALSQWLSQKHRKRIKANRHEYYDLYIPFHTMHFSGEV